MPSICEPCTITSLSRKLISPESSLYGGPGLIQQTSKKKKKKNVFNTLKCNVMAATQTKTGKKGIC